MVGRVSGKMLTFTEPVVGSPLGPKVTSAFGFDGNPRKECRSVEVA